MSVINPNKLLLSSDFYSVQGEGRSTGVPSYFIRLGLCNLTCGMSSRFLKNLINEKQLEDGEIFKGDLELEGKATWTCDSTSQWAWRGVDQEFDFLLDRFKEEGVYDDIIAGRVHLIWTGGEPTMVKHQESIVNFFQFWRNVQDISRQLSPGVNQTIKYVYNEIETNGTVVIGDPLFELLSQINCSPKLSNSGLPEKQRIKPDAIKKIKEHKNYTFKFVISTEDDIKELMSDFVIPFKIPLCNVYCMPGLDSQENFHERTNFVLEMAKKYKFIGGTRLHISAWDKTLNV